MYENAAARDMEQAAGPGSEAFVRVRPLPPELAGMVTDVIREATRDELHETYRHAVYRVMEQNPGLDESTAGSIALRICHQEVESMAITRRTAAAKELIEEYATDRSRRSIAEAIRQNPGREDDVWAAAGASVAEALRNGSDHGRCGCGREDYHDHNSDRSHRADKLKN